MKIIKPIDTDTPAECPYISGQTFVQEYFLAMDISPVQQESFLNVGWRHFGYFYFRPRCPHCRACRPLRVRVADFSPSKSQRRTLRKNDATVSRLDHVAYHPRFYEIYTKHNLYRFGRQKLEDDEIQFKQNFFYQSTRQALSLYFSGEEFIGIGFLDIAARSLSSIYFAFDTDYESLAPGTYSILKEISTARENSYSYYYLGFYVKECSRMAYKARFKPFELFDSESGLWIDGTD